jgi:Fe-S oxidoreductase
MVKMVRQGKPDPNHTENPPMRIWFFLTGVVGQKKLWRRFWPGLAHAMLFYGFILVNVGVLYSIFHGMFPIEIPFLNSRPVAIMVDAFMVIVIVTVIYFAIRRAFIKPYYLTNTRDGWIVLSLITLGLMAELLTEAFAWRAYPTAETGYFPVGRRLGELLIPASSDWPSPTEAPRSVREFAHILWSAAYWAKIVIVGFFLLYIPSSKHFHVMTSLLNSYFQNTAPKGRLRSLGTTEEIEKKMEEEQPLGASKVEDFTWKDLLDTAVCTECGRCTSVCPANLTGKPLDPRKVIIDMKRQLFAQSKISLISYLNPGKTTTAGAADSGGNPAENPLELPALVGGMQTPDELWACTTCRHCMTECPVFIEHVPKIMDMRRYLVMQESDFPKMLTPVFNNLERNGNPWQINNKERADWLKSLPENMQKRQLSQMDEEVEVLFWVGCMGSFDNRNKKVTTNLAMIMEEAGIKWGILGKEETCSGDPARRTGNEYLFAILAQQNAEILNAYQESHKFKKIVTACPHCFNTLKNEYPEFGANFEVIHHSKLIAQLVDEGRITVGDGLETGKVTYHDPCYLGRYNDIYDAPRYVINSLGSGVEKVEITEMPRSRDNSFCCGGGGGQAWMEEKIGQRVNQTRIQEAADTGAEVVAASCPFCITMFEDGIKGKKLEDKLKVLDITELVQQSKTKKALPVVQQEN